MIMITTMTMTKSFINIIVIIVTIMKTTTIAISNTTKQRLQMLGTKGQTYDALISKIVEMAERSDFLERQKAILKKRFAALASEAVLVKDWNSKEDEKAWKNL